MSTLHGKVNPWSAEQLSQIHKASLNVLEKTGVYIDSDLILDFLEQTEARVDRPRRIVRFPSDLVERQMREAPGSWDRRTVSQGFFSVSADCGSEMVWDHVARCPRPCRRSDLADVPRLVEAMENINEAGNLVFTNEVPPSLQDMIAYRYMWLHTQKKGGGGLGRCPSNMRVCSPRVFDDLCDMLEVKLGREKMQTNPEFSFFMGVASPLRFGRDVLELAAHALKRGQVVGIGGNCVCGIQSPITAASNIVVDHAERLAGLGIVTAIDPKAKFYFCNHTYFLDLQSGDIASGSPEQTLLSLLGQKLLAHCGFNLVVNHPILDSGGHCPDGQVAAEHMMYMLLTALGGAKGIGGAGELKELFSYEQLVIDNEIAGYVKHLLKGAEITEETIALETINDMGIGGDFLTSEPTVKFMRECYYAPQLFYRKRLSEWTREGGKDLIERSHEKVKEILSSDTPTFLSDQQLGAMDEIIRRTASELCPDWDPTAYL